MKGIVWSYITNDGIEQLLKIEKEYNRMGIETQKKVISTHQSYIIFDNNDIWSVVRASDNGRGHATNISYIDRRIPQNVINTIIKPATKAWPYQAFKFYFPSSCREDEEFEATYI